LASGAGWHPAADWQSAFNFLEKFLPQSPRSQVTTVHARRLPHYYALGQPLFVTWRLHHSLPANRAFPSAATSGEAFLAMDRLLDNAQTGPLHLRRPEIAGLVHEAIHYRNQISREYDLHSFVVMANHVHLLITPHVAVAKMMQSLKRFTARGCNKMLGHTGKPFWQDESYDRLVRNQAEFAQIARYIEMNPVNAGLVATPEEFRWSSARPIANRPQVANLSPWACGPRSVMKTALNPGCIQLSGPG